MAVLVVKNNFLKHLHYLCKFSAKNFMRFFVENQPHLGLNGPATFPVSSDFSGILVDNFENIFNCLISSLLLNVLTLTGPFFFWSFSFIFARVKIKKDYIQNILLLKLNSDTLL